MIMEELLHEDEIPVGRAKDLRGQVFGIIKKILKEIPFGNVNVNAVVM